MEEVYIVGCRGDSDACYGIFTTSEKAESAIADHKAKGGLPLEFVVIPIVLDPPRLGI